MKREGRAALALIGLVGLGLILAWLFFGEAVSSEGGPSLAASSGSPLPGVEASLAAAPTEASLAPQTLASRARDSSVGGREPAEQPDLERPARPGTDRARAWRYKSRVRGHVFAPDGTPAVGVTLTAYRGVREIPLAFVNHKETEDPNTEKGDRASEEAIAIARAGGRDPGKLLTVRHSDERGAYQLGRYWLGGGEVLIVATGKSGVGVVRIPADGLRQGPGLDPVVQIAPDLFLQPRATLSIQVKGSRLLGGVALSLVFRDRGDSRELPRLDASGRALVQLPSGLLEPSLVLEETNWLPVTRKVSAAELAAGKLVWRLRAVSALNGRVLSPRGRPWRGSLGVGFRGSEGEFVKTTVRTDAAGRFEAHGIPPDRLAQIQIVGALEHAYYQGRHRPSSAPVEIRLGVSGALEVNAVGASKDYFSLFCWAVQILEASGTWRDVPRTLIAVYASYMDEDEARTGLSSLYPGRNKFVGLPPGTYRVVLTRDSDHQGASSPVDLGEGGRVQIELKVTPREEVAFRGRLVSPGADLSEQAVRVHYQTPDFSSAHEFRLDSAGGFAFEDDNFPPAGADVEITVPALGLSATLRVVPSKPDLGTIVLEVSGGGGR
ncbi:MAG: hypothetical protein JKY65_05555 [Planctomycetes bacterium]|nr:hypothetical protein [Planctomycetota bacterium]